jgi:hypothetical protein
MQVNEEEESSHSSLINVPTLNHGHMINSLQKQQHFRTLSSIAHDQHLQSFPPPLSSDHND